MLSLRDRRSKERKEETRYIRTFSNENFFYERRVSSEVRREGGGRERDEELS